MPDSWVQDLVLSQMLDDYDPVTFAGAATLFAAVGLVAGYAPARRASRMDAAQVIRHE
jgi:ABC-type antimicrobial peptide transport system permease subunit